LRPLSPLYHTIERIAGQREPKALRALVGLDMLGGAVLSIVEKVVCAREVFLSGDGERSQNQSFISPRARI
jgi:hypothetical protein